MIREENGYAAMLAAKMLVGVAPEVKLRECVLYTSLPSMNKAAHSGFETKRDVAISTKHGYQWPYKKYL